MKDRDQDIVDTLKEMTAMSKEERIQRLEKMTRQDQNAVVSICDQRLRNIEARRRRAQLTEHFKDIRKQEAASAKATISLSLAMLAAALAWSFLA